MRLIDADALKFDIMCVYGSNPKYINWLNHAPTIDAVPVIRCKDCRFFREQYLSIAGNNVPAHWCEEWYGNTPESGFCHLAERKEE